MSNQKVYDVVTERICAVLEQGVIPWRMTWSSGAAGALGAHRNGSTGHVYSGTNALLTYAVAHAFGYQQPLWLTFKQAIDLGGNVRKGEKGTPIIFASRFKVTETDADTGEDNERSIPFLKHFYVWNIAQCENIALATPLFEAPKRYDFAPVEACERIVEAMPHRPEITHSSTVVCPCYFQTRDSITMPDRERFESPEFYYSALFHELAHSTRHASRLDRRDDGKASDTANPHGSPAYAREELVAELGAAFLSAVAGIDQPVIADAAAYIANWLRVLRNDTRLLVTAAAHAQRAADFILNTHAKAEEIAA